MRDFIHLYVNGAEHRLGGPEAHAPLASWLRRGLGLTGTKVVCAEGDCGACTVLLGRPRDGRLHYRAVNSCILFPYQIDGSHVVTVEGLAGANGETGLTPVQEAMRDHHGSQCGYCTPGFVMALTALFEAHPGRTESLTEDELRAGLSGNLCRCTGYVQIIEAGRAIDPARVRPLSELYDEKIILESLARTSESTVRLESADPSDSTRRIVISTPRTLADAIAFRANHPKGVIICGASDLGVQYNKGRPFPEAVLCLTALSGFDSVTIVDGVLTMGAGANWNRVAEAVRGRVPAYYRILQRFGSPHIRNAGTVGGNFANASPIADAAPFHFVAGTEIELAGPKGRRRVAAEDFYLEYKKTAMEPDELIVAVHTPLPEPGDALGLYKMSRRKDLDIAAVTAGFLVRRTQGNRIEGARVAYGGVAPTILRMKKTEDFLAGREFNEATFREAGEVAASEIHPISDVRGSAEYRTRLARNIPLKFYRETVEGLQA